MGRIPSFVSDLAGSDGPLAEKAAAWVIEAENETPAEPESEFAIAVRAAVKPAIQEMITAELIEIESPCIDAAVTRLVAAAENAANTKQLIAAVVRALLDAPEVEEVYGSDTELRSVFMRHFEG
jgi:hypothetical protein